MNAHALTKIAQETLKYLEGGSLKVDSVLYTPEELAKIDGYARRMRPEAEIFVTNESTLEAARREASPTTLVLNFASGKNPGGGFLRGTSAQEESLARSSSLYPTLTPFMDSYYKKNREAGAPLYTDHMILSRNVTVYREDNGTWLTTPYQVGVLTVPAPNCSELSLGDRIKPGIRECLNRRARYICAVANSEGYSNLVLGAWGCGVFKNDPEMVARAFRTALALYSFEKVTFAIYDSPDGTTYRTFQYLLGATTSS